MPRDVEPPKVPMIRQYTYAQTTSTLDAMNVDTTRTLDQYSIPDWRHLDEGDMMPLIHFIQTFEAGARATGDAFFGARVAEANGLEQFSDFGRAIQAAMTVYDAMQVACRLVNKQAPTLKFWLIPKSDGVVFCRKQMFRSDELQPALDQLERYTLFLLVNIVRAGAGPEWQPSTVYLSMLEDQQFENWSEFADATVHFQAPFSGIFVPDAILSKPLPRQTQKSLSDNISAERRLLEDATGQDFANDLRTLLPALLLQKSATLTTVAEVTKMSSRTLQRRLAESGQTFTSTLSQARFDLASRSLTGSDASVSDISEATGYEHPQHFIRAFKTWAGVTPSKYRETHKENQET